MIVRKCNFCGKELDGKRFKLTVGFYDKDGNYIKGHGETLDLCKECFEKTFGKEKKE